MSQRCRGHWNYRRRGNVWPDDGDWAKRRVGGGPRHRRVVNGWWVVNWRCWRVVNLRCKMFDRWGRRVMDKRCWSDVRPHQVVIRGQKLGWKVR